MNYRRLGRTCLDVSEIGHGLWGIGGWTGGDDDHGLESLRRSIDLGVTFFDSAWAYGDGKSDRMLGGLAGVTRAERIVAASKVPPMNLKWPADPRDRFEDVFPESHVRQYADHIRKALGRPRIDLLQLHVWDDHWAENRTFARTIDGLKKDGVISWFGISLNRWEPSNGIRAIQTGLVDVVQVIYNIFDQSPEDELFPECRKHDVGVVARVPLDEGSLGGQLTDDTRFPSDDWRSRYFGPENLPATLERVSKLKALVPADSSLPEMALRFILSCPDVSTTIVGMRTVRHVVENVTASAAGALPTTLIAALREHRWDRRVAPWAN